MLIDEFASTRMWAAEAERQQRERERARQVREHGRWLRSAGRSAGRKAHDARVDAATGASAEPAHQEAGTTRPEASGSQDRELAHAGR